jgi:hypothetical protein
MQLCERDRKLLAWCGEQYTVRTDLLAVLMAQNSGDAAARARGRVSPQAARRRVGVWRRAGLVRSQSFVFGDHATVWLTAEGMAVAGLPWRPYEPTLSTYAHRHAVGLVRAEAEAKGLGWVCERELREGQGGQPLHLPDGVVISQDDRGKQWRTAIEVELTRKTEARVVAILRHLLSRYDDVVYRVHPSAQTVVTRSAAALTSGSERIMIRPYPPPTLAAVA